MGGMNALVIEANGPTARQISSALATVCISSMHVSAGKSGLRQVPSLHPDIIVCDILLPDMSGLDMIRELRARGHRTPILVLSTRHSADDKICGLNAGADDYMTKPFERDELIARVRALLRRCRPNEPGERISYDDLTLDSLTHQVVRGERLVELTPLEFTILEYLLLNGAHPVSARKLYADIWGTDAPPDVRVIEAHICHLRNKLRACGERDLIRTIRRVGYQLQ